MSGETANIAAVAKKVSKDIFSIFKWELIPLYDENFPCHKTESHKLGRKRTAPKHPTDVVFRYFDPYLNLYVYLNTDLKSYGKTSITPQRIKTALVSLARTIECAESSQEWQKKYVLDEEEFEVRGMLFVYNHDGTYENDFFDHCKQIKLDDLQLAEGQILHIIEPTRIWYLCSVVHDIQTLQSQASFPMDKALYSFVYTDLTIHKAHGIPAIRPATIETLCSPFMIIKHQEYEFTVTANAKVNSTKVCGGYVIYYSRQGDTHYEFLYLIDALSRLHILKDDQKVRIRVVNPEPSPQIISNYERGKKLYLQEFGEDSYTSSILEAIEFEVVNYVVPAYMPGHLAWERA